MKFELSNKKENQEKKTTSSKGKTQSHPKLKSCVRVSFMPRLYVDVS